MDLKVKISQAISGSISDSAIQKGTEIIHKFIANGMKHLPFDSIPGNKIFLTDVTSSYIAYYEDNVVVEHYTMFPNSPCLQEHSHPFANVCIFLGGDLIGSSGNAILNISEQLTDGYWLSPAFKPPYVHGFAAGNRGALLYNIQIWETIPSEITSASVIYYGNPLGPVHKKLLKSKV